MTLENDNEMDFVLESKEHFSFEGKNKAQAVIEVGNGEKALVSVRKYSQQYCVDGHLSINIPGKTAFSAYKALVTSDDNLFALYIDPADGRVKAIEQLEAATATDLDRAIDEVRRVLRCAWNQLEFFAQEAAKQSFEDKNAFKLPR